MYKSFVDIIMVPTGDSFEKAFSKLISQVNLDGGTELQWHIKNPNQEGALHFLCATYWVASN